MPTAPWLSRPTVDEHRGFVYPNLVGEGSILDLLEQQLDELDRIAKLCAGQDDRVHAPYAWPVIQVWNHCAEAERIFGYRALRRAAGDKVDLPGWDEQAYAASGYGRQSSVLKLAEEWRALRQSNLLMFQRLAPEEWVRGGVSDGKYLTVRATAYILVGHAMHHLRILDKRLLG